MRNVRHQFLAMAGTVACVFVAGCGQEEAPVATEPSSRPVKLVEISGASNESSARYPAVIGATQQSELSFQVGGLISELPVSESDAVEQGTVIAQLDARDFESNVTSARATYNNAEDEYQRAARLAEQDAIAQSVLEQRESQRDVAKAQFESAEKALQDSVLRAPYNGVIAAIPARRLQTVSAGTSIATIINMESLDATINVPASIIAQVPTRQNQGAVVMLDAAPGQEIEATFSEASLVADATSQTYAVTFSFAPPENLLVLPGMNATLVLSSTGSNNSSAMSVTVPLAAVQTDGSGQFVWKVDPESMLVSKQAVEIEDGIGETVVVTSGLAAGDQIVGAGGSYLANGMQVTPWTE